MLREWERTNVKKFTEKYFIIGAILLVVSIIIGLYVQEGLGVFFLGVGFTLIMIVISHSDEVYITESTLGYLDIAPLMDTSNMFKYVKELPIENIEQKLYILVNDETMEINEYPVYIYITCEWVLVEIVKSDLLTSINNDKILIHPING